MNKEKLDQLNDQELSKKLKTQKMMTGMLTGMVFVMFITTFFIGAPQTSVAMKFLPFAFLPLILVNFASAKKMKEELERRQNNN